MIVPSEIFLFLKHLKMSDLSVFPLISLMMYSLHIAMCVFVRVFDIMWDWKDGKRCTRMGGWRCWGAYEEIGWCKDVKAAFILQAQ